MMNAKALKHRQQINNEPYLKGCGIGDVESTSSNKSKTQTRG